MSMQLDKHTARGFTLVEMAVVLVILGFVISALLLPVAAQRDQAYRTQTDNQLEIARKALLGFAQTYGRLPCPAPIGSSTGLESPIGGGNCANFSGYLPAATLGIQPVNSAGLAVDGWENPILYAVSQVNNPNYGDTARADFTTKDELNAIGISTYNPAPNDNVLALAPDLMVCDNSSVCPTSYLTNNAVAVIYSTGKNGPNGVGADEINQGVSNRFYSRIPTDTSATGGVFDDQMIWISPFVLYNAMIDAGQLH